MAGTIIMFIGMETVAPMRMLLTAKVTELVRVGGAGPALPLLLPGHSSVPHILPGPHITGETGP